MRNAQTVGPVIEMNNGNINYTILRTHLKKPPNLSLLYLDLNYLWKYSNGEMPDFTITEVIFLLQVGEKKA